MKVSCYSSIKDNNEEINKLVAERILGWKWQGSINGKHFVKVVEEDWDCPYYDSDYNQFPMPDFCNNMKDAWLVVAKMRKGFYFNLTTNRSWWEASFAKIIDKSGAHQQWVNVDDDNMSKNICLAALLAMGVLEDDRKIS